MKKFVSIEKRSKKEQREYFSAQRSTWGTVNPCKRVHKSRKDYNRAQGKRELQKELPLPFFSPIKNTLLDLCNYTKCFTESSFSHFPRDFKPISDHSEIKTKTN